MAQNYNSLEASIPLLTTMANLASMFYQVKGPGFEVNESAVFIHEGIAAGSGDC